MQKDFSGIIHVAVRFHSSATVFKVEQVIREPSGTMLPKNSKFLLLTASYLNALAVLTMRIEIIKI